MSLEVYMMEAQLEKDLIREIKRAEPYLQEKKCKSTELTFYNNGFIYKIEIINDNFEKWIKTRIQELSEEYDEAYDEHATIEENTLLEGKIEAFVECLRKHRQLKEKREI